MNSARSFTRLSDLALGQMASITAVHSADSLAHRLKALGFRAGKHLQVLRRGKMSGPLHVRLGTTDVILRRSEAAQIEVQPTPDHGSAE
jgi:ferrous iron transport protein A